MGGNYQNDIYKQLMEVMSKVDSLETEQKQNHKEIKRLNNEVTILSRENTALRNEVSYLKHENAVLTEKCEKLTKENILLRNDNARLRSIINNDSSNTSLPPSTDKKGVKPANTFNSRKKTGRKSGGQKGHNGTTLTKAEVEEKIKSNKCKHEIRTIGDCSSEKYITKYIIDLKTETVITELRIYEDENGKFNIPAQYRSDVVYGEEVKAMAVSLYSEGVMSNDRIASFLNAVSNNNLGLSEGSVYGFCKKMSELSEYSILHLEEDLLNQNYVATDATTVMVNGEQNYVRNFSTDKTVVYHAMKHKSINALKKIRFLSSYSGLLIHDHETALYHFGTEHAECNVHIIRYLRKNTEETKNKWSDEMIALLCEMNETRKKYIETGKIEFSEKELCDYERRYHNLIAKGYEENEKTVHKYAKSNELTLLNRMEKYSHNHLLFLHDFSVLFENNISERDLRKVKNRQKMAGGFRKDSGHEMYCNILTIIETLKRRKMGIIENIKKLFIGTPAIF